MPFYLTPKPDDFNQELQICIAETLYDVDYLEQAWELLGGSEEQLLSTMMQISQVVAQQRRPL